jgi:hypothetical protein
MIRWFKTKKQAEVFRDSKEPMDSIFKDKRGKHKAKPFGVCSHIIWINRS